MGVMIGWLSAHHRRACLVTALLTLAGLAALVNPGLRRDYTLESFVASGDESYAEFHRFTQEFTSNEIALIAVRSDDAMSESSMGILRNRECTCECVIAGLAKGGW